MKPLALVLALALLTVPASSAMEAPEADAAADELYCGIGGLVGQVCNAVVGIVYSTCVFLVGAGNCPK